MHIAISVISAINNTDFLSFYSDVDIEAQFSINQSRADEITMREDYGSLPMAIHDDGFGDIGFDDGPDFIRDAGVDVCPNNSLFKIVYNSNILK